MHEINPQDLYHYFFTIQPPTPAQSSRINNQELNNASRLIAYDTYPQLRRLEIGTQFRMGYAKNDFQLPPRAAINITRLTAWGYSPTYLARLMGIHQEVPTRARRLVFEAHNMVHPYDPIPHTSLSSQAHEERIHHIYNHMSGFPSILLADHTAFHRLTRLPHIHYLFDQLSYGKRTTEIYQDNHISPQHNRSVTVWNAHLVNAIAFENELVHLYKPARRLLFSRLINQQTNWNLEPIIPITFPIITHSLENRFGSSKYSELLRRFWELIHLTEVTNGTTDASTPKDMILECAARDVIPASVRLLMDTITNSAPGRLKQVAQRINIGNRYSPNSVSRAVNAGARLFENVAITPVNSTNIRAQLARNQAKEVSALTEQVNILLKKDTSQ